MTDNISFKQDDFFNFLLTKLIDLETDVLLNNCLIIASFQHLKPDGQKEIEKLKNISKEQRPMIREQLANTLSAELKGMSIDMDDFLKRSLK